MAVSVQADAEFCDQILELINGTHWVQGRLRTFCWVPTDRTEGDDLKKLYAITESFMAYDDEDQEIGIQTSVKYVDNPAYAPDGAEPVFCMKKAQWCLIGMVMQVADLLDSEVPLTDDPDAEDGEEEKINAHDQAERICVGFFEQLPASYNTPHVVTLNHKITAVENWNDLNSTTKQDVIDLVTRARDAFLETKEQTDGSNN